MAELSVIIPTRNRVEILLQSLGKLYASILREVEVVVVNDGDDNLGKIHEVYPAITIIRNPGDGVASARNAGAAQASSDLLLFIDDDMWMTTEAIEATIRFHRLHDNAALNLNWVYPPELHHLLSNTVFGRFLVHYGFVSLKGWSAGLKWNDDDLFESDGITSQNLSMRKATFQKVGGYTTIFPFAGFEDHDFSKKLKSASVRTFIDPLVMTFHNESDRVTVKPWMERRRRGGYTRKVAVSYGLTELALEYSGIKHSIMLIAKWLSPLAIKIVNSKLANRFRMFDPIMFKITDWLLAESIHRGYNAKSISEIKAM